MSRSKRARTHSTATAVPPAAVAPRPAAHTDADELHRRAIELREYRMGRGARPAGFEAPAARATDTGAIAVTFPGKITIVDPPADAAGSDG